MQRGLALVLVAALPTLTAFAADETVDLQTMTRIRDEAFGNSKVMETLGQLTDVMGPRLTGSPQIKKAEDWARQQLEDWGLANAHLESWPFGRGWSFEHVSVRMLSPAAAPLIAYPKAWTPGTEALVKAKVLAVKIESEADFEKYKGKLAGLVLFMADASDLKVPDKAAFNRYTPQELDEIAQFQIAPRRPGAPLDRPRPDREAMIKRFRFQKPLREFLAAEKVVATVEPSDRDGGIVGVGGGGSREKGENPGVTALVMAAEHYNRVKRLLDRGLEVELELEVRARFHDDDTLGYNVVAEIPGVDKKGEVVMLGGHIDSWHAGTGATDDAAGVAVAMEAVRILRALDVKPRRTIRVTLWGGEEQGLLGSRAYVKDHFAARPDPPADQKDIPEYFRRPSGALTVKPEHAKLSAYFNLDNGTGKIRGIYTQENAAAVPLFEAWLKPFADLGASTITMRRTGGTDHQSFDGVGLPGFQFIQDQADYMTRTHHTNMDVYDRVQKEDVMQAAAIMAAFVYDAATRPEMFPRKPMPKDRPAEAAPRAGKPAASPVPAPSPAPPVAPAPPAAMPKQ